MNRYKIFNIIILLTLMSYGLNAKWSEDGIYIVTEPDTITLGSDFNCEGAFQDVDGSGTYTEYWQWAVISQFKDTSFIIISEDSIFGHNYCTWQSRIDSMPGTDRDILQGDFYLLLSTFDSDSVNHKVREDVKIIYPVSTGNEDSKTTNPKSFDLYQNYPNPFNPETVISYELKEKTPVSLTVYDMLGKEIINLVDEFQSSGRHSVVWNGCDPQGLRKSSGIYFYTLKAGKYIQTRKMILIQ